MPKYFGQYGGQYVGEVLKPALDELTKAFQKYSKDKKFLMEYQDLLANYVGRPTPLLFAENMTKDLGGARVYIKLEGLANTGAHKINNALGQVLLAKRIGKKTVIAETGAGQHGVATAAAAARLGLNCEIFMGMVDVARQQPNVFLMKQYGAKIHVVTDGTKTLKDAVNACLKHWTSCFQDTHYVIGSALGPYPYPDMVRFFQSIIGREIKKQIQQKENKLPDVLIACCGGGSNSIGMFTPFIKDKKVRLIAVEAGGIGNKPGQHAIRISSDSPAGIIEGYKSRFLQTADGQVLPTHSISAGLDYAGIGPELADLAEKGRVEFTSARDLEALSAYQYMARTEGLLFAMESAHAAAAALKIIPKLSKNKIVVINMSGRGDKDIFITAAELYKKEWTEFLGQEIKRLCD
ncbi:tryptophan synthase beta chain [Candidatus Termititenax dinenymphae]|uniref:Tryptophan synthase beta chain n=1 Tax=Candidatus Termititenax dinenymphae TaxID=2218523 RepID=A0A388TJ94_9BACT|nr:tryptophan synthase beta chain [Candidatus Termititenax dinenymphae]